MAQRRSLRRNAMMDTNLSNMDLFLQASATDTCTSLYARAYTMFEWGIEFFTRGVTNIDVMNWFRALHYMRLAWFFRYATTEDDPIRRYSGHEASIFRSILANRQVRISLQRTLAAYERLEGYRASYPRVPITAELIILIVMNYLDTGCNFKQSAGLWQIPKMSWIIKKGLIALLKLDNIKLPTKPEEWLTSMRGFEKMHGLPNAALSLDVTVIRGMIQKAIYFCPELKTYVIKAATIMDSSGMYREVKLFSGSHLEPDILTMWPFFHRLKATERLIALPGWPSYNRVRARRDRPLDGYPRRVHWPKNPDGSRPRTETTAPGILVDSRYSNVNCGLFIGPKDRMQTMHIYNQRHCRTRFFHERQFGILSQYTHLKQRPMQMDSTANHPIRNAIRAAFMIMNQRVLVNNNPEHACLRFCTAHRVMSAREKDLLLDNTPYQDLRFGESPRLVADMIDCYAVECLDPYTDDNIRYLLNQLHWPIHIWNGRDVSHDAFNRELVRILRLRIENRIAVRRGQLINEVRPHMEPWQRIRDVLERAAPEIRERWLALDRIGDGWRAFLDRLDHPDDYNLEREYDEALNPDEIARQVQAEWDNRQQG